MAAAAHPDVRAKVQAGEISDPFAVHDMMMDPEGKANFEGKDFSPMEGESAVDAEEKPEFWGPYASFAVSAGSGGKFTV